MDWPCTVGTLLSSLSVTFLKGSKIKCLFPQPLNLHVYKIEIVFLVMSVKDIIGYLMINIEYGDTHSIKKIVYK